MDANVTQCLFSTECLTCPNCGYVAQTSATYRHCRVINKARAVAVDAPVPQIGDLIRTPALRLGDAAKSVLLSLGITKERVSSFMGTGSCRCDERQEALNQLGYRLQENIEAAGKAVQAMYFGSARQESQDNQLPEN